MRWIRLLLITLVIVLLVIGAGFVFLITLDLNDYKPTIERYVANQTGRSLAIDGRIDLTLGKSTTLTVTDVRFGNPDWAADKDMARVERASIVLDVRSLWSGPVIIELLELDKAELNYEELASGEDNWTFGDSSEEPGDPLITLILSEAHVADLTFTVTNPALDHPLEIRIDRLDQTQDKGGLFDAKLRGMINERAVNISGKYGPLESLLATKDLTIDAVGQFDTLSITANGLIDDLVQPRRPRAKIEIAGPDIDHVTAMLGLPDFGSGDLDFKISLEPGTEDIAVSVLGRIGEHRSESSGTVSDLVDFEQVSMQVSLQGPDLNQAARIFRLHNIPEGPYQLSGTVVRDGPKFDLDKISLDIGQAQFRLDGELKQFPDLEDATLSLEISGKHLGNFTRLLGMPGKAEGPFQINGRLEVAPGGKEIFKLDAVTQIVEFKAAGELSKNPDFVGTSASLTGQGANITALAELFGVPIQVVEPFRFEGDIRLGDKVINLPQEFTFTTKDNQLSASGVVGFDPLGGDTNVNFRIKGVDLAKVALLAGVTEDVPSVSYDASGNIRIPPEGYRISGMKARIGDASFSADGLVSQREDFVGTRLKFAATVPKINEFIANTEALHLPEGELEVSGEFELSADAVQLREMKFSLGEAAGLINVDIGLPLASAHGTFDVTANGKSLQNIVPDTGPWKPSDMPFEIRAQGKLDDGLLYFDSCSFQLGETRLTAQGIFDIPPGLARTNLTISARMAKLSALGTFDKRPLPDTNFSLDAKFSGTPESFSVKDMVIRTGDSDLAGSLIVRLDQEIPDIKLQLKSALFDVTPLLAIDPELAKEINGADDDTGNKPAAGDGLLIPKIRLPLEQLKKFNAVIDIDIATYRQYLRKVENLILDATVLDGKLDIERVSGKTNYGNMLATMHIKPMNDSAAIHATFSGENVLVGISKGRSQKEIDAEPKYSMAIDVEGAGLTLREIAASLNGQIKVSSNGGEAANTSLRFIYGNFFSEFYTAINPFAKTEPYTQVSCIMLVADIQDGLFSAKPGLAMQTDKVNLISVGTINLKTEKLDIDFKTGPRSKISISAGEFLNPFLKISGTLASPYLTVDTTGAIVSGGAAVMTGGLSLLGKAVWDRVFTKADPCGEIAKQAEANRQKKNKKWYQFF